MMFPLRTLTLWLLLILPLAAPVDDKVEKHAKKPGRTVIDEEVEVLRTLITKGNPEWGIPVLDPLEVESHFVSVRQEPHLAADVYLSKVRFLGFGSFVTKTLLPVPGMLVPPNPTTIQFLITVPLIHVTGRYKARGHSTFKGKDITIHEDGPFLFLVKNFVMDVKMELDISFRLSNVRVIMTVGDVHAKVQGGGVVSEMLNSEASYRFERWFVYASPQLEEEAEMFLRYYVKKKVEKEPMWVLHKMEKF